LYGRLQRHFSESAGGVGFDISLPDSMEAPPIIDDAIICVHSASDTHAKAFADLHQLVPSKGHRTGYLELLPEALQKFTDNQHRSQTVPSLRAALMASANTALREITATPTLSALQRFAFGQ
jgi:hypothetical protein